MQLGEDRTLEQIDLANIDADMLFNMLREDGEEEAGIDDLIDTVSMHAGGPLMGAFNEEGSAVGGTAQPTHDQVDPTHDQVDEQLMHEPTQQQQVMGML